MSNLLYKTIGSTSSKSRVYAYENIKEKGVINNVPKATSLFEVELYND